MTRFKIFFFNGYNGRDSFEDALNCAAEGVRNHYRNGANLAECFALIYDTQARKRVLSWLDEKLQIKYRNIY